MDMETVDSTVNAQHRVNGCGQGRNEVEVVGDVGEAISLSLSLSLSPTGIADDLPSQGAYR